MFKKILIANRGEIACRVIKTAQQMGIPTVAVYSEADKGALHVAMAVESVCIGPAPAAESYLAIDRILQPCVDLGVDAVHPGYGFLSENADFAQQLAAAGVTFIGPSVHAITSMGDKLASKLLAQQVGVNTIPGHPEAVADADVAVRIARQIGYPVMLKASAGGGGKGMRVAHNDGECREGFQSAANEARASFGDDRILVEKYIERPRHIEIQVMGDQQGHVIHLGERECSVQRRHQKVIEEAPSPLIDDATRDAMGAQAVALAKAVDYNSAGTVEFIVDQDQNFYFLEMNTRLQVEHPVTELVTGIDLVEWMIRVAAGEPLPLAQADVQRTGWAIEARVYAEDPSRGFLPSTGKLVHYLPPTATEQVRIDSGVYEGNAISVHYDPMIAKVIAYGATRSQAISHLRGALSEFCIRGLETNISFLSALLEQSAFTEGQLHTGLIDEIYPDGFNAAATHPDPALLIVAAGAIHRRYRERAAQINDQLPGYEPAVENDWVVIAGDQQANISVSPSEKGYEVELQGRTHKVDTDWQIGQLLFRATIDGAEVCIQVERRGLIYHLRYRGDEADVQVLSSRAAELLARMPAKQPPDTTRFLLSPMPGLLAKLGVIVGDKVKTGQDLAVVEAMKMENLLRADREGIVLKIHARVGDALEVDQPIIEYE